LRSQNDILLAESRDQISRQTLIVGDLEDTRRNSVTAVVARKLLQSLQRELEQHIADRDRLRRWLEKRQSLAHPHRCGRYPSL
jgi:hypothetical protein